MIIKILSLLVIGFSPMFFYKHILHYPVQFMSARIPTVETIVILGHKTKNGKLSDDGKKRLDTAIELLRRLKDKPLVILSGTRRETALMHQYLLDNGIRCRIVEDQASKNTLQNLRHAFCNQTQDENGEPTTSIVSSAYHMLRVRMLLDKLCKDAILYPSPSDHQLVECFKECYKFIFNYIFCKENL